MTGPPAAPTLLRSVVKNAVSLTGGRILLALLRFIVALVIVQRAGLERFGEFALMLSFILIAEWLSDFGLTDIAVRQISADARRRDSTMGAFLVSKAVQSVVASAAMGAAIALLGYPEHMVRSGVIAAAAVVLYGGVQYYRVEFRVRMTMERDVAAELLSAVILLAGVWWATRASASLELLTLCYVVSRGVNLLAAAFFARHAPRPGFGPGFGAELRVLVGAALPLGVTGLLVSAYDAMDAIALSQLSSSGEVGIFTVAMRVLMLAVVAEQAFAAAVFPVLAGLWARDKEAFVRTLQVIVDWGVVVGGGLFCALYAGAHGIASFVKQDPQAVAAVLQLLAWAILARVIVTLVSPMVVISGKLLYTVWITAIVVVAKGIALAAFASQGAVGAATAYLFAELAVGLVPTVIVCQRVAGVRLRWAVPIKVAAIAAIVALAMKWLGLEGSIFHGALALMIYLGLAAAGAIRPQQLRQLYLGIAQRRSRHV